MVATVIGTVTRGARYAVLLYVLAATPVGSLCIAMSQREQAAGEGHMAWTHDAYGRCVRMTAGPAQIILPLNAFLLRRTANPGNAWSEASGADISLFDWAEGRLDPLTIEEQEIFGAAIPGDVIIALLRRASRSPSWQTFIKDALNLASYGSSRESLGAAIFCAISSDLDKVDRAAWVVWTFGSASRALRRSSLDPRFGLLVALNLLAAPLLSSQDDSGIFPTEQRPPHLREIRYRTPAPYAQQTGHRAARDIPVDGFRVDRSSDLVATVGGSGADPALTTSTVLGGRSLRFRAGVSCIQDLVELGAIAIERSGSADYKEAFSWIDNIRLVEDTDLVDELRRQIALELISNPESPSVDTILPDDLIEVGDDRSIRYIVFPYERGVGSGRVTLTTSAIADVLGRSGDPRRALDDELRFLDESETRIGAATILECVSANLRLGDEDFIAYDGDFYLVDKGFVDRIDDEVGRVPISATAFPPYRGQTEPAYNSMVGRDYPDDFVELDRALITLPGQYGVEASDLVALSGALIHLKRKGKSSTLSHLFLQAANSCELLQREPEAWHELQKMIEGRARNAAVAVAVVEAHEAARQNRERIEVVFGFLGDWKGRSIISLPLFSRISLASEARRIANLGFRPTVALISIR